MVGLDLKTPRIEGSGKRRTWLSGGVLMCCGRFPFQKRTYRLIAVVDLIAISNRST
jgi:hypothetical protein